MASRAGDQSRGTLASSAEFTRYDQVDKPAYHLAEAADDAEAFDEEFEFVTCDLSRYLHGDAADRSDFVGELGSAMRDIGFAILTDHGVDTQLFEAAAVGVEELFTGTSAEEKLRYRAERHGAVSEGYFPLRETSDIHPDLVEGWVFGRRAFDLDADPDFDAARFWPRPALEPQFRRLVAAEQALVAPLARAILEYLGCEPHLLEDRLERPHLGLRLNYYPPISEADAASGAGRLLGHEDVDLFTLLPAPTVEGLQVLGPGGRWLRMEAPRGSIILNTGDYLQRISNDILPSTTHRVSPPRAPADAARARVSFALNAYLPPEDVLRVLPGLGEPKYEPVKVITFHTRTTAKYYGDDHIVE